MEQHKKVVIGVEIEAYSIDLAYYQIGRRLSRPKPGLSESGERFSRDSSIGTEYNSRPFMTIREAFFLLRSGLRKYLRGFYRGKRTKKEKIVPLLIGTWTNRFAGTHLHISIDGQRLSKEKASSLAKHIHDHIPFFIALGANSPIWMEKISHLSCNRVLRGSQTYFVPIKRDGLNSISKNEMVYSPGRKSKPPTLELRFLDSNLPEFLVAIMCLVKAVALHWLRRNSMTNKISYSSYLQARKDAGLYGMKARLPWNDDLLEVPDYLDRFLWIYREELKMMDIPEEIFEVFRLLKKGMNGSQLLFQAARQARKEHPQTWQRRFAKRYANGLTHVLSGNRLSDLAKELEVEWPNLENVWLGRRNASIDG